LEDHLSTYCAVHVDVTMQLLGYKVAFIA